MGKTYFSDPNNNYYRNFRATMQEKRKVLDAIEQGVHVRSSRQLRRLPDAWDIEKPRQVLYRKHYRVLKNGRPVFQDWAKKHYGLKEGVTTVRRGYIFTVHA